MGKLKAHELWYKCGSWEALVISLDISSNVGMKNIYKFWRKQQV